MNALLSNGLITRFNYQTRALTGINGFVLRDFLTSPLFLIYHKNLHMYKEGLDVTTGRKHSFVFIAVEKAPPYSVNILQADDFFIEHGQHLFRKYLDLYHECKVSGNWYGYNGKEGHINNLSVPNWLVSKVGVLQIKVKPFFEKTKIFSSDEKAYDKKADATAIFAPAKLKKDKY